MDQFVYELIELADEISQYGEGVSKKEAIKIAVEVQRNKVEFDRNKILAKAFVADAGTTPSALEALVMVLGYKPKAANDANIVDAIYNLKNNNE